MLYMIQNPSFEIRVERRATSAPRRSFPQEPLDPSSGNILVQDKLVISQQPPPPKTPLARPRHISPSTHSPSKSSCSSSATCCSSFTAGSAKPSGAVSCSSSSSSTASSALSSKDRSFSNDFLWSCAKENSHLLQINSLKVNSLLPLADKFPDVELGSSPAKPRLAGAGEARGSLELGRECGSKVNSSVLAEFGPAKELQGQSIGRVIAKLRAFSA
ncbi:hypothetical protein NL676_006555 [Syzygium grande]|nr:hypothetical protein NL676_006555 [Syzygium grande]